jgi:hypothetical protein
VETFQWTGMPSARVVELLPGLNDTVIIQLDVIYNYFLTLVSVEICMLLILCAVIRLPLQMQTNDWSGKKKFPALLLTPVKSAKLLICRGVIKPATSANFSSCEQTYTIFNTVEYRFSGFGLGRFP